MSSSKRIEYIVLAKGICIFLVVFNHISQEGYFCNGNYPMKNIFDQMRMPLYFILSGLFFKDYAGGIKEFLLRKVNRILIPYIFFYSILRLASRLVEEYTDFASTGAVIDKIWAPIWFLRCLFIMNGIFVVAYYAIRRFNMSGLMSEVLLGACMITIGIIGYPLGNMRLAIGTALTCMPYLWLGYILNRKLHFLQRKIPWWCAIAFAIALFALVHYMHLGENLYFMNEYNSPITLLYLSGFAGTLAVLLLSSVIKWMPIISYIGRYSIIVLCTHMLIVTLLVAAIHYLPEPCRGRGYLESFIFLAIVIALSMLCIWFLKKYLPWFTAQKDLIKVSNQQIQAS